MQWLFVAATLGFAGWAVWRGFEAQSFNRLFASLDGELTEAKVRAFLDKFETRNLPNAQPLWERLKGIERRVMTAETISAELKEEFRTLVQTKGLHD